ncbi:MAG TPA: hypothetical protein VGV88_02775 [Candidatus Dormibacteraeota bacterium]|nr:hypothetical protein [Candidatus Dormibacteraeota bacterium]
MTSAITPERQSTHVPNMSNVRAFRSLGIGIEISGCTLPDQAGEMTGGGRQIGAIGTAARIVLGVLLLVLGTLGGKVIVSQGHLQLQLQYLSLVIGLLAFPAVLVLWQWLRLRRDRSRLEATGPVPTIVNIAVFALLVSTASIPAISFFGFAAMIFYGASLLVAAVRGYAGCEVLAASNWMLRRDDQIGCLVLSPVDQWEHGLV